MKPVRERVYRWSAAGAVVAALLLLPGSALAHESDTPHIEPELILLAIAAPVVIFLVGGLVAVLALRSAHKPSASQETASNGPEPPTAHTSG